MKTVLQQCPVMCFLLMSYIAMLSVTTVQAQTCPPPITSTITSFSNTYYPGQQAIVSAGSTAVAIGAANGTIPISAGDVLLIIQMQGAQINAANDITYGNGVSGRGYQDNVQLFAGNMEYIVATNSVPLTGGTLTLLTGTVYNYKKADFGADGQYTYQVIRVPVYYELILNSDITAPSWDGATGGVIVMAVKNNLTMNGHSINVTGAGFRGGGGIRLGVTGTASAQDFVMVSPPNDSGFHASKGEGIAGTPRLINLNNYDSLQKNIAEGYPGGSFGMGAPGNAGGGGSNDVLMNLNRSGGGGIRLGVTGTASAQDFVMVSPPNDSGFHASKGEGIAGTPRLINLNNYDSLQKNIAEGYPGGSFGMGAPGNAGGGGSNDVLMNLNRSGGGGGGNGGAGGNGGNSYATAQPQPSGGYAGAPFAQRSALRLVMGGGGGAGDNNNGTGTPGAGLASSGAAGGGIVLISAGAIINSGLILANGSNGNTTVRTDASGGGGAGGSVLINARSGHSNLTVYANGGNGGSNSNRGGVLVPYGPGGGGGGGVIYSDGTLNAASSVTGGKAGTTYVVFAGPITFGAQAGAGGSISISLTGPVMAFPPGCTALPIEFLLVKGKRNGTQVLINWEVTNEKNVTNYIIERSNNGADFFTAGIVSKKPGNGDIGRYNFSDAPAAEKSAIYYRIVAAEATGHKTFSKIITVKTALAEGALDLSPVPAIGYSTIKWTSTGNNNLHITLFNAAGGAVLSRQYRLKAGVNELLLNLETLPAGIYIVKASDGVSNANGKLVIHQ
ncbi:T9SS type A sorting domain-containing protein [Niastella caeni]|uniref:T9SS type A sorting domain-containing protein n=1 Tax=Niastella caeni TaxID=2569763 RepID=A0A4S8HSC2_9BACT|nr:T9SS type A sorting domain-containing protein [Niastella caeni]THU38195.1 T9SS type A sorting domain-containing protein [Niastella caeni]